jgi:hypothetical protein
VINLPYYSRQKPIWQINTKILTNAIFYNTVAPEVIKMKQDVYLCNALMHGAPRSKCGGESLGYLCINTGKRDTCFYRCRVENPSMAGMLDKEIREVENMKKALHKKEKSIKELLGKIKLVDGAACFNRFR